nr:pediocin PA-1 [Lactiplantibacillus plantarum]
MTYSNTFNYKAQKKATQLLTRDGYYVKSLRYPHYETTFSAS